MKFGYIFGSILSFWASYFLLLTSCFILLTSYFLLLTFYFLLRTSYLCSCSCSSCCLACCSTCCITPHTAERACVLLFSQLLRELFSIHCQAILKPIEAVPSISKRRGERAQRASEAPGERTLKGEMADETTRADNRTPKRKPRPQDHTKQRKSLLSSCSSSACSA